MFFEKVCVVGSGSICVNIIKSLQVKNIAPVAILYKEHNLSPLSMFLNSKDIENYSFNNRDDISDFLGKIEENTLIISANNIFLFPKNVVEKQNLKIVNFHNALLPKHRGMNAPTWTIFEQDKKAGITWHLVNENIDDGDIIIQREIELNDTETAMVLIRKLMNLAFCAYKEIEEDLLNWKFETTKMDKNAPYQIHYSKDVPNNGLFDKSWDFDKMSAFLRSLDWGCVQQFEKSRIEIEQGLVEILSYKIEERTVLIETQQGQVKFSFD